MDNENLENQNSEINNADNKNIQNQPITNETPNTLKGIVLEDKGFENLYDTAKWAKFMNIVMTVGLGLMVVFGFIFSSIMTKQTHFPFPGIIFGFIYAVIAAIYIYPILTIFKFSSFIKQAYIERDSIKLTEALRNLKGFTQFTGIMTLIGIASYGLMLIVGVIMALTVGFHNF